MKTNNIWQHYKIPIVIVLIHTVLVGIAFSPLLSPKSPSHGGGAYALTIIVIYIIDLPIGILDECLRAQLTDFHSRVTVFLLLHLFIGGLYWFLIGLGINQITNKLRKKL
jgi:hypothetical protein